MAKNIDEQSIPVEPKSRIHINEFIAMNVSNSSPMYVAGFKATVDKTYMFLEEWQKALEDYDNRDK